MSFNNIKEIKKHKLFYDKYVYRVEIRLPFAFLISLYGGKSRDQFIGMFNRQKQKSRYSNPYTPYTYTPPPHQSSFYNEVLSKADPQVLGDFIDWRNGANDIAWVKLSGSYSRFEDSKVAVFGNDRHELEGLLKFDPSPSVSKIVGVDPVGVRYFANEPDFKYRVYLKSRKVSPDTWRELRDFIDQYRETKTIMIPSHGLVRWIYVTNNSWKSEHCQQSFFIGYDDPSTLSLLSLMFPNIIGKHYKLEKRPD